MIIINRIIVNNNRVKETTGLRRIRKMFITRGNILKNNGFVGKNIFIQNNITEHKNSLSFKVIELNLLTPIG